VGVDDSINGAVMLRGAVPMKADGITTSSTTTTTSLTTLVDSGAASFRLPEHIYANLKQAGI